MGRTISRLGWLGLGAAGLWWLTRKSPKRGSEPDVRRRPDDRPDPVDEATAESFPASDPPSWAGE